MPCNRHFDGALWRIHWWDFKHCNRPCLIAVVIAPRVRSLRFRVSDQIKNFDRPLPRGLAFEDFLDRNGFDVKRFATMCCTDGVFKFRDFFMRHSLNQTPPTRSFQSPLHCGRYEHFLGARGTIRNPRPSEHSQIRKKGKEEKRNHCENFEKIDGGNLRVPSPLPASRIAAAVHK